MACLYDGANQGCRGSTDPPLVVLVGWLFFHLAFFVFTDLTLSPVGDEQIFSLPLNLEGSTAAQFPGNAPPLFVETRDKPLRL